MCEAQTEHVQFKDALVKYTQDFSYMAFWHFSLTCGFVHLAIQLLDSHVIRL